jgi:glucose/arabinose dehydrogenase
LDFGPDGYLYAGLGDGGSAGDPQGNGQKLTTLLGKILRLDVDSAEPYAIPADNPFGDEIWAYGLRNPWRISFDTVTGDLYIGDVGQGTWEEIDYIPAGSPGGANFGWNYREGAHEYKGNAPAGLIDPVAEYSHPEGGCSVTGGYVYRGSMPEWNGIYLYGDYCTGFIWGLIHSGSGWQAQLLFDMDVNITSFGQDESGEVYLLADGGGVYRLVRK